jgi:hypothetical protein
LNQVGQESSQPAIKLVSIRIGSGVEEGRDGGLDVQSSREPVQTPKAVEWNKRRTREKPIDTETEDVIEVIEEAPAAPQSKRPASAIESEALPLSLSLEEDVTDDGSTTGGGIPSICGFVGVVNTGDVDLDCDCAPDLVKLIFQGKAVRYTADLHISQVAHYLYRT